MKTISIKGKPYVTVAERLKEFRSLEKYKGWKIRPTIVRVNSEYCVILSTILDNKGEEQAWGIAEEHRGTGINATSYVEVCETSAHGRSLAMLGLGVIDDIASGDEVALARDAEPNQIQQIEKLLETSTLDEKQREKVSNEITELTFARAERCLAYLYANQRDPIASGDNYSQGDINRKLDQIGA